MKTSLLILISFLTITAHSQNNLFFDEVKLIRFSTQPSVTVPSGKVWKIVGSDLEGTNQSVNININGEPFFLSGVNTGVNNQIWLPEGTVVSYALLNREVIVVITSIPPRIKNVLDISKFGSISILKTKYMKITI